eukprot:tig00000204_g17733.t1
MRIVICMRAQKFLVWTEEEVDALKDAISEFSTPEEWNFFLNSYPKLPRYGEVFSKRSPSGIYNKRASLEKSDDQHRGAGPTFGPAWSPGEEEALRDAIDEFSTPEQWTYFLGSYKNLHRYGELNAKNDELEQQLGAAQQEMAELRAGTERLPQLEQANQLLEQENGDLKETEKRLFARTSSLKREAEERTSELQRDNCRLCERNRELEAVKSRALNGRWG